MQLTPSVWPANPFARTQGQTPRHFFFEASITSSRGRMRLDLELAPLHDQQANSREQQPAQAPLKCGVPTVDVFAARVHDLVSLAAQHAPERAAQRRQHGIESADQQVAPRPVHVFARHQRHADAAPR